MASLAHLLCSHQCYEQGNSTFPELARLEELVLDRCNIRSVHLDTFANLPRLSLLSLQASASKSSIQRFVITEKAPTRASSWLKAATTAFTFKSVLIVS